MSVKQVEGGLFSSYANNQLKEGEILEVFPPEGKFIYQAPSDGKSYDYAAFAAGSGITPILSILKSVLKKEHFFISNASVAAIIAVIIKRCMVYIYCLVVLFIRCFINSSTTVL